MHCVMDALDTSMKSSQERLLSDQWREAAEATHGVQSHSHLLGLPRCLAFAGDFLTFLSFMIYVYFLESGIYVFLELFVL